MKIFVNVLECRGTWENQDSWEIWELIINLRLGVSSWFCGLERILRDKEETFGFCWEDYGSKPGIGCRILLYKCKPKRHSQGLAS